MCGICCVLSRRSAESRKSPPIIQEVRQNLLRRGPDCHHILQDVCLTSDPDTQHYGTFLGSVLHMRGEITKQPSQDECGNILLWNGEIFDGVKVEEDQNDTTVLLQLLAASHGEEGLHQVFQSIKGPWAFIYWQTCSKQLWFGRDYFGRRSLLWRLPDGETDVFALSSVAARPGPQHGQWQEIPAKGIFCISMESWVPGTPLSIKWYPWQHEIGTTHPSHPDQFADEDWHLRTSVSITKMGSGPTSPVLPFNRQLPDQVNQNVDSSVSSQVDGTGVENGFQLPASTCNSPEARAGPDSITRCASNDVCKGTEKLAAMPDMLDQMVDEKLKSLAVQLIAVLGEAVKRRVFNLPRGRESNRAKSTVQKQHVEQLDSLEKLQDKAEQLQLSDDGSGDGLSLGGASAVPSTTADPAVKMGCPEMSLEVEMRTAAVRHSAEENCSEKCRVAILFSGGVDSMVIAALADRFVPPNEPIDLLNVAFQQKEKQHQPGKKKGGKKQSEGAPDGPFQVPDRITGHQGLEELVRINPSRHWNFVEVNVTLDELRERRSQHVNHLLYPLQTVLDDSIGCAIWFASRGRGRLANCPDRSQADNSYSSPAKVLLVGMGADEQLAGYSRHRSKFRSEGWRGLLEEVEMEVDRISSRNLGRDDRIISDHGKESRFPFLDEDVVSYLSSVPIQYKANLTLPRGIGEKLLLRVAARELGLSSAAVLPKRAIQFGSRIAKMENSAEKASDRCNRLTTE
ncbi:ASNSD1 [Branchiostoma lanceolatum]|uniref:Asparagine synthetase domain-containing protein 1 n=1 Tax=Branchiostoma lanceolatum TaxID=7740 RepID=A0A8J9YXQ8_BRALA|nr:ASNSD1 [Branchiostoma lanceolatum]